MPDSTYQRFLRIVAMLKMFAFLIDFIGSMRSNMTRSSRPNLPNMHLLKKQDTFILPYLMQHTHVYITFSGESKR